MKSYLQTLGLCLLLSSLAACNQDVSSSAGTSVSASATADAGGSSSPSSTATAPNTSTPTPNTTATVSLSATNYTASAGTIVLTGKRTGDVSATASVHYSTADGSASAGSTYVPTSGTLSWAAGDTNAKTITVSILQTALSGSTFSVILSSPSGAQLGTPNVATVTIQRSPTASVAGMKLISRGVKSYASSGTAASANDAEYNTYWRSSGTPATLAYDLSTVASASRKRVIVAWYNDLTYQYDHSLYSGQVGYNNVGSYTIEANAAAGGGSPPSAGWVVLAVVSNNTLHSREHLINFDTYNWIRINASVSDGSPQNEDIAINMDVYDASQVADGWFFGGDSITANCMGHGNTGSAASDSFGNQLYALTGFNTPQENAGMPGWAAIDWDSHIQQWIQNFPGKYVTLNLGTNDAAGSLDPTTYYNRMSTLVEAVIAAGKIPVIPTIPWSRDATHAASIPGLNAQIHNLYQAFPSIVPGPDLYTLFQNNQSWITSDNVHPTDQGCQALRAAWVEVAAKLY